MALVGKDIERISKALGDPNRLKILTQVRKQSCMGCAAVIDLLQLAQPSVSHHLKQLTDSGLLDSIKEGRNIRYMINREVLEGYIDYLSELGR